MAKLAELGLYNLLSRISQGQADVDAFLLTSLRERGLVSWQEVTLTDSGVLALQALAAKLISSEMEQLSQFG